MFSINSIKNIIIGILCIFQILPAFSAQPLIPLATDQRMKTVSYDTDNVVNIVGSHLVQTAIVFSQQEMINGIYIGDQIAWTYAVNRAAPYMFFIKPTLASSETNMTVTTNKHTYYFHLKTYPKADIYSKKVTYNIRFIYPDDNKDALQLQLKAKSLGSEFTSSTVYPWAWNWNYSFTGDRMLAPIHVFDDGKFTYFQFNKQKSIPAIFLVDKSGKELLANTRTYNDYLIVNGIGQHFSLRSGTAKACVFNDENKN